MTGSELVKRTSSRIKSWNSHLVSRVDGLVELHVLATRGAEHAPEGAPQ
jgi:hypothetical protein